MNLKFKLIAIFVFLISISANAQVKVGDNPTTIDDGSALEIESTTKAFVPSRVTDAQMNAIPTPLPGAIVYNTELGCLYQYRSDNGNLGWQSLCQRNGNIVITLANNYNGSLGSTGNLTVLDGEEKTNNILGASFDDTNNQITLPAGDYLMTFAYEGSNTSGSGTLISSYFFDFPQDSGVKRIHNNQSHKASGGSNHGGCMISYITLTAPRTFTFRVGRGSGGNYTGTVTLSNSSTLFEARRL